MFDQVEAVDQMMEAGASGYLLKNASLVTLLEAIRHVVKFGTYYD
ncbi:MAG: response regulator transcription factor, partial [Flavobacterium sp.]|nr:response regulator transcription factor [Flavobacterium sp.]